MRICLVYDCLFPWTVGGAERTYRGLAERLAAAGHDVTYVTLRQWERDDPPRIDGVRVVAAGPRLELYVDGRRRIAPPLVFGAGVLWHLLRHGRDYDVVHTASFPYFSLLAAGLARRRGGFSLVVDWHEVWSREYWRDYLGGLGGRIGLAVQRLCMRVPQRAFCRTQLHARRLREQGYRGEIGMAEGAYEGPLEPREPVPAEPLVVFAGRHIPEKRAPAVVPAVVAARDRVPGLRGVVFGDGPEREAVLAAVAGSDGLVTAPGFVAAREVEDGLARAMCMLLPSAREGFGLVVVEAASHGTPSVVARAPDNAAVELVEDGVNGFVAASAEPEDLADAVVRVHEAGDALRESTRRWFAANVERLSLEHSLEQVVAAYGADSARR